MKRIIIAVLLLAACLGGALGETAFISRSADNYIGAIEEIDGYMLRDDFQNALTACTDADRRWTADAPAIDALLIHDYVDSVGLCIARMLAHIENGSPDLYFAESRNAKKALTSIRDSEYPFPENIL